MNEKLAKEDERGKEIGPSLLDPESTGGKTALDGFDFQRRYALILLIESLQNPDFATVVVEGAEDVEVRFDTERGVKRRAVQVKNHRVTTGPAMKIIDHFHRLDEASPGTYTSFVIVCTELDDTLRAIHNGLERYHNLGSDLDEERDKILTNTRAKLEGRIKKAVSETLVPFVIERVRFEPHLNAYQNLELVRGRALDLLLGAYPEFSHVAARNIYLRLGELVGGSTSQPITRQQAVEVIEAVQAEAPAGYDYRPVLRAPLREVCAPLLKDRVELFGGRGATFAQIADFIQNPQGGYLVITAPAGFGKTALMANLVDRAPDAFAYHFFTPLYGDHTSSETLSEAFFLENVVEQMAQWHGHKEELPTQPNRLRALYHRFVDEPLEKTQVLVLDGLDEVTHWKLAPYLSSRLPDNLHIITTLRDVGQDWRAQFKFPAHQTTHLPLDGLVADEVAQVLRAAGGTAVAFAEDPALLHEVVRLAAYEADESLGADPFYVRLLAEDATAGELSPEEIGRRPSGLDNYLKDWWKQAKAMAGDQPARDLFGTLTVALGPISRADLEAINASLVDEWAQDRFDEVLDGVRRFVMGDERRGYALAHPRLRNYMRTQIRTAPYLDKLLTYCARWQGQEYKSRYALTHYAAHLADAGRADDLYDLISQPWMEAKLDAFHSHRPFAEDVALAIEAAEAKPIRWEHLIGGCLIYATLGSMATNVPPKVLGVLVQTAEPDELRDILTTARGRAALMQDRAKQTDAYRLIGQALWQRGESDEAREVLGQALAAAEAIGSTMYRAMALSGMAQILAQAGEPGAATQAVQQALAAAKALGDEHDRAVALSGMAQALAQAGEIKGAAQAAQLAHTAAEAIECCEDHRAEALSIVAAVLAQAGETEAAAQAAQQGLAAAQTLGDEHDRAVALSGMAEALAQMGEVKALRETLMAAEAIGNERSKAEVLSGMAQALATVGDVEALRETLAAAEAIGNEEARALALSGVTQALATVGEAGALRETRAAAAAIGDEGSRASALSGVAQALATVGDVEAVRETLASAEAIGGEGDRAKALSRVAQALAHVGDGEALRETLAAAQAIGGEDDRAKALSGVAQALAQVGDRETAALAAQQALAAAEAIGNERWKADALSGVAQALAAVGDVEALREVLAVAEAIGNEEARALALSGVAQALATVGDVEALREGLAAAEALSWGAAALMQAEQPKWALAVFRRAFWVARSGGRNSAFSVLEHAAPALAEIDGGQTLARVYHRVMEVESWWGAR